MTEYHDDPDHHGDDDDLRGIDPPEGKTHDGEPLETFPDEPDAPTPAPGPNPPKKYVGKLLTLKEAAERLGISYPTATRLTAKHGDKIPSVGKGRYRRYPLAAIAVMKELRVHPRQPAKAAKQKPWPTSEPRKKALDCIEAHEPTSFQAAETASDIKRGINLAGLPSFNRQVGDLTLRELRALAESVKGVA